MHVLSPCSSLWPPRAGAPCWRPVLAPRAGARMCRHEWQPEVSVRGLLSLEPQLPSFSPVYKFVFSFFCEWARVGSYCGARVLHGALADSVSLLSSHL